MADFGMDLADSIKQVDTFFEFFKNFEEFEYIVEEMNTESVTA